MNHFARRQTFVLALALTVISVTCADRAEADTFGSGENTFDIEFVTIGDPGNAPDDVSANPDFAGSVPYTYRMGKFEISEQMIDKANTLGGLAITKDTRGANKPATRVNWNEAARFVNWLNTSSGSQPAYKFALQPGDAGYFANSDIQLWAIGDAGYNPNNLYRNSQAKYFLPNVDEWYKSAYYDPTSGVYYDYPTGSNSAPTAVGSGTAAGMAVYDQAVATGPAEITLAGGLSPYGTLGQGGNVLEWEETQFDLVNVDILSPRAIRGSSWNFPSPLDLSSSTRVSASPGLVVDIIGFRVASNIPEPNTLLLGALAGIGLFALTSRDGRALEIDALLMN